jgi:hypothetical protein
MFSGIPPDAVNVILNDYRSDEELHERIKDYAVKVELANIHVRPSYSRSTEGREN